MPLRICGNKKAGATGQNRRPLNLLFFLGITLTSFLVITFCHSYIPRKTEPAYSSPPWRMQSPEYGMHAFLWWRPEVADRDLQLIKQAGFQWVKQSFAWRDIEGAAKGHFDWTRTDRIVEQVEQYGLKLLVRVDRQPAWAGGGYPANGPPDNYEDFGDFLYALASRYRGRIHAYQIWNEPNLNRPDGGGEWGGQSPDPAEYVRLLRIAYRRIKEADPNALVVSAGLTPTGDMPPRAIPDDVYLEMMYQAMENHSSDGYFDALGVNAPGYRAPPEMSPDEVERRPEYGGKRFFCFRRVEDLRRIMVKYGDEDKQIVILEMGWTSDPRPNSPYHWHSVDEQTKGEYLVRAYKYARENWAPWIGLMVTIYIPDVTWTPDREEYWWALLDPCYPELCLRPAYVMLKEMPK